MSNQPANPEFRVQTLINEIDARLPQTQCTQCDYPRCRDYAAAIAHGDAEINQCPPGGQITIDALAELLGRAPSRLNPAHGEFEAKQVAVIDEAACIGCRLCIDACPVDCIIGAAKRMHTVVARECTGCKLCLPACPVDCIDLQAAVRERDAPPSRWPDFSEAQVLRARAMNAKKHRRDAARREQKRRIKKRAALQRDIRAALARHAAKRVAP